MCSPGSLWSCMFLLLTFSDQVKLTWLEKKKEKEKNESQHWVLQFHSVLQNRFMMEQTFSDLENLETIYWIGSLKYIAQSK